MKKIVATLVLAGLIASAVVAEAKTSAGRAVQTDASTAVSTTAKKHKKHRKNRKAGTKKASAKPGK